MLIRTMLLNMSGLPETKRASARSLRPSNAGTMSSATSDWNREGPKLERGGSLLNLTCFLNTHRIVLGKQNGQTAQVGNRLAKQFEPFARGIGQQERQACYCRPAAPDSQ